MKILFLNSTIPNYLTDGLFHGLRSIPGITVVDAPRMDYMYQNASAVDLIKTGSKGGTIYKLLSEEADIQGRRTFWQTDVEEYDYLIFTDIFEQCDLFNALYQSMHPKKRSSLCIVDGYDVSSMFPFFNNTYNLKVRPWSYFYTVRKVNYFKREHENAAALFGMQKERFPSLNKLFSKILQKPSRLLTISMSIPEEHIEYIRLEDKEQTFVNYNVDKELNDLFPEQTFAELGKWQPAFKDQNEYFDNIRKSRFGITAKRAGWDCLRHYEYAAKGAILCFRDLHTKDSACAPFELNHTNCIPYSSKDDLQNKINRKSILELEHIQENQYEWIKKYTTKKVALRFLDQLEASKKMSDRPLSV